MEKNAVSVETVLLCSITDDVNADILVAALKEEDIQPLVIKRGAGGYLTILMGMNAFGVDIYVPTDVIERAQLIFGNIMLSDSDPSDEIDEEFELEIKRATRNKRIKGWLIFLFWIGIPLVVICSIWLIQLISSHGF